MDFPDIDSILSMLRGHQCSDLSDSMVSLALLYEALPTDGEISQQIADSAQELANGIESGKWDSFATASALFALGKSVKVRGFPDVLLLASRISHQIRDPFTARQLLIAVENYFDANGLVNMNAAKSLGRTLREEPSRWDADPELFSRVCVQCERCSP